MRIAVIHVAQETNDFNPVPTTLRDYEAFGIFEGPEIFEKLRGLGQIGGHLEAVEESGLTIEFDPDHPKLGGRRRADRQRILSQVRGTYSARPRGGGSHRRTAFAAPRRMRR